MGGGATATHICSKTSSPLLPTFSPFSTLNFPVSVNTTSPLPLTQSSSSSGCCYCACETQCAQGKENQRATASLYKDAFGNIPSKFEVETAIAALHNFMQGISSSSLLQVLDKNHRVVDAFRLLRRDPIFKRMVVSLSSDKALWDAVMKNEMLQQLLQGSCIVPAENCRIQNCNQETDLFTCMLSWIMNMTKAKVAHLIQNFQSLMNEIFQTPERKKPAEESREVDDRIRSSLLLSVVILLVVVVARIHRA